MRLHVDGAAATAPYDQIKQQITAAVTSAELAPGEKLPTVRALATDLGLAANTVARAYRELELAGVLETRGRAGTFVKGSGVERAAREAAWEFAERVRALGVSPEEAVALVRKMLR